MIKTAWGFSTLVVVWVGVNFYVSTIPQCALIHGCGNLDLFGAAFVGVGFIAPAWIAGALVDAAVETIRNPPPDYGKGKWRKPKGY